MNKIRTKEELKQELEQWKTMLSREVYSYLEALIKLDNYILNNNPTAPIRMGKIFEIDSFKNLPVPNTALMLFNRILNKNTITPTIRENLLNLDIYRDISTYNIYWHLQSIFSSYQHNNIILEDNRNQIDGIKLNTFIKNLFVIFHSISQNQLFYLQNVQKTDNIVFCNPYYLYNNQDIQLFLYLRTLPRRFPSRRNACVRSLLSGKSRVLFRRAGLWSLPEPSLWRCGWLPSCLR